MKRLWDEDTGRNRSLQVVLLGSALLLLLLLQNGLSESLAGRCELVYLPHWSFAEMRAAFRCGLDRFLFYGGYPGSAPLVRDPERWSRYIRDSLIETSIARDVLLLSRIHKPALLRRLFELGCSHSGQILSYNKMLGQLQDAGNTTTLAHYLELLDAAGMVGGLAKFAAAELQTRASSPKLQVHNHALLSALDGRPFAEVKKEPETWGRIVESAVGAHLLNAAAAGEVRLFYWRDGDLEVDFVIQRGPRTVAIEVKSGRRRASIAGMAAFAKRHPVHRTLLVGGDGIPLAQFLLQPASHWLAD